jgi:hypothetical protein
VVSLTSYPPRYSTLALTLRCLMSQDVTPDAVVLWVAHDDLEALPESVTQLQKQGLTIRACEDTRQYKKIVPALSAYPDAFIVTADDDVYYSRGWLRRFVENYEGPWDVLCQRGLFPIFMRGEFQPYNTWPLLTHANAGPHVFPTGVGGVMYPPGRMCPETTVVWKFMELCPNADDLWLYWMAARSGLRFRFMSLPASSFPGMVHSGWRYGKRTRMLVTTIGR